MPSNDPLDPIPAVSPSFEVRGVKVWKGFLPPDLQAGIVEDLRGVIAAAPLFSPVTPWGKPMTVRMTSAGGVGWVSDRRGYRYADRHPDGTPWPPIPDAVRKVWQTVAPQARAPECCLVNFYSAEARMGLHQDRDEADFSQPVVSVSLGDSGLFRVGNLSKGGTTESFWLDSGDVLVMEGAARLIYHGVDRIRAGSSTLLPKGGRINLTLRVVT